MSTPIAVKDVTVALPGELRFNPPGRPNVSYPKVSFGDGTLVYPTDGIPLPTAPGVFGFLKNILFVTIMATLDGLDYAYDKVNNTIRIFHASTGAELTTSDTPAATVLQLKAEGE